MFANRVDDEVEHRLVAVGVQGVADVEGQRVVAVNGHAAGQDFGRVGDRFGEEVHDLPALVVDDGEELARVHLDEVTRARRYADAAIFPGGFGGHSETLPKGHERVRRDSAKRSGKGGACLT